MPQIAAIAAFHAHTSTGKIISNNRSIDNVTLAKDLGLDPSTTSRRVAEAIELGFLENLENKRGKRAKLVLGKPLPDDELVLPPPGEIEKIWIELHESSAIVQHLFELERGYDE